MTSEAEALAQYLLPEAKVLRTDPALINRVTRDYSSALLQHRLAPLGLRSSLVLRAWEGRLAPRPAAQRVRKHLLLMTAILESQPKLTEFFLPRDFGHVQMVWVFCKAAFGMGVGYLISPWLHLARGYWPEENNR